MGDVKYLLVFTRHPYVFFGEMYVYVICPYLIYLFIYLFIYLMVLSFMSCFYILQI